MKPFSAIKTVILLLVSFSLIPSYVFAQYRIDMTPAISVQELYDDNIYLERDNENSDYITTVTLSFDLNMVSEKNDLTLRYAPAMVRYHKQDQNDTVRHFGTFSYTSDLSANLALELSDTYLKSEQPLEETEDIIGIRRTRNTYQRNIGRASMRYIFGPENTLNFGFNHRLLLNKDVTLNDGTILDPFADLTYWFNVKNGIELSSQHTFANFTSDDNTPAQDDYSGNTAGLRYLYRFSPHTTGSIGYAFTYRDFDGTSEDYDVHEGSVGFTHAFSPETSLDLSAGYFTVENERSEDEDGFTYDLSLSKILHQGTISISGSGGWNEAYLESERRGLTRYQALATRLQYQLTEKLANYAGISYRQDKDSTNRKSKSVQANYGLQWAFHRYLSLSLDYLCSTRDDDLDTEDYLVNRVMMSLTATRLYRK